MSLTTQLVLTISFDKQRHSQSKEQISSRRKNKHNFINALTQNLQLNPRLRAQMPSTALPFLSTTEVIQQNITVTYC